MNKRRRAAPKSKKAHSAIIKKIQSKFPKLDPQAKLLVADISKTAKVLLLRLRILDTMRQYPSWTVKTLYYRVFSLYRYPNNIKFYKRYGYSLKKLRKLFPTVDAKFEDPTRKVRNPDTPAADLVMWVEKSGLEYMLEDLVVTKYHVSLSAIRGFPSITFFRKAIERGLRTRPKKLLLALDHDPSGMKMEEIIRKEMASLPGLEIERIAVTREQARRYRLPSTPTKKKDSRQPEYLKLYGNRAWEVESIPPKTLLRIVERKLKENLPAEFLQELKESEHAEKISRPIERQISKRIRELTLRLKKEGLSDGEIRKRLKEEFLQGSSDKP